MRATYLGFRSPKEETPFAYSTTQLADGKKLNRFEQCNLSESRKGTFPIKDRFTYGSIYTNVFSTKPEIGPGIYREGEIRLKLREKACKTKMKKSFVTGSIPETHFEMVDMF